MGIPTKPIDTIPENPVGAHDWHVQIERNGRFVKCGGSEGNKSYAHGYLMGRLVGAGVGREMRLCDAQGRTYVVE